MRPAFHHAAAAALLATGLVASAWGQMQTPSGSHHRMTRSPHANRPADNASFPSGLRRCADMVDRDERASCAGDLYDENGQPKR